MLLIIPPDKKFDDRPRGFRFIIPGSAGSTPSAIAGNVSVTRLIHKSEPVPESASPSWSSRTRSKLLPSWQIEDTAVILNVGEDFSTGFNSGNDCRKVIISQTMSEASFETSVPVIPIPTPMSAVFKAGASLTPSPVMATTLPWFCHALTILTLCSGATRA